MTADQRHPRWDDVVCGRCGKALGGMPEMVASDVDFGVVGDLSLVPYELPVNPRGERETWAVAVHPDCVP